MYSERAQFRTGDRAGKSKFQGISVITLFIFTNINQAVFRMRHTMYGWTDWQDGLQNTHLWTGVGGNNNGKFNLFFSLHAVQMCQATTYNMYMYQAKISLRILHVHKSIIYKNCDFLWFYARLNSPIQALIWIVNAIVFSYVNGNIVKSVIAKFKGKTCSV